MASCVPELEPEALRSASEKIKTLLSKYESDNSDLLAVPTGAFRVLQPCIMGFLDVKTHISLRQLNKEANKDCDDPDSAFYASLWETCCDEYGLYHPHTDGKVTLDRFKAELWPHAKKKWGAPEHEDSTGVTDVKAGESFNVDVMARLRPGALGKDKVSLPLHQFLKLKRRENLKARDEKKEEDAKNNFVGEEDPAEFLCPFTQVLMREPVLLTHCGRIVDRSIVGQGRDPWSGRRLDPSTILPQPELQAAIMAWRTEKEEKKRAALNLDRDAIKEHLIEQQQGADPVLLKALLEAEAIAQESDRIFRLGNRSGLGGKGHESDDGAAPETNAPVEHDATSTEDATNLNTMEGEARDANAKKEEEQDDDDFCGFGARDDAPRILDVSAPKSSISMHVGGAGVKSFDFDKVFAGDTTQNKFYEKVRVKTVNLALHGFNACFLAYGQTGSGKTFSFFGPESMLHDDTAFSSDYAVHPDCGVSVRICLDLLAAKQSLSRAGVGLNVTMNYLELYDEKASDLFVDNSREVMVRKSGDVVGALEVPLEDMDQTLAAIRAAQHRKRFSATAMNDRSSRSHSVLIFNLTQVRTLASGESKMLTSVLHCVDLAGSERLKRSKASGVAKKEAATINSSLLVLGKVIEALATNKSHVPYLESKLTTLLRSAFGGNSRTTVTVCARTEDSSGSETLSSLRFGERASAISNSIKQCASSAEHTLASLNASLESIGTQIESLKERGKERFAEKLIASYQALEKRKLDLVATMLAAQQGQTGRGPATGAWATKPQPAKPAMDGINAAGAANQNRFAVVEAL